MNQAPKPYYGKPENQKNQQAVNMHGQKPKPPTGPKKQPATLALQAEKAPKTLPPPQHKSTLPPTATKDENLKDLSLFAVNQNLREVKPRLTFTPAATGLIDVSRAIHQELRSHEAKTVEVLAPEVLDYYSTALFWMRATDLKSQFGNELTTAESTLLSIAANHPLTVPAPLLSYLKSYGGIQTKLESNLFPEFPSLPTTKLGTLGGFYGEIADNDTNHNLYEEIPCLGVLAYAVQQVLTNTIGPYKSNLETSTLRPNSNLLGFRPLSRRRDEARSFIEACNIYTNSFPSNITDAGFNLSLILAVSELLRETKTFKVTTTNITSLGMSGSQSQTVYLDSRPDPDTHTSTHAPVMPSSLGRESTAHIGMALYTCSQLFKAGTRPEPNINTTSSWCCVDPLAQWTIPPEWVTNRNSRRNLPSYWYNPVFTGTEQVPTETILALVQRFTA